MGKKTKIITRLFQVQKKSEIQKTSKGVKCDDRHVRVIKIGIDKHIKKKKIPTCEIQRLNINSRLEFFVWFMIRKQNDHYLPLFFINNKNL